MAVINTWILPAPLQLCVWSSYWKETIKKFSLIKDLDPGLNHLIRQHILPHSLVVQNWSNAKGKVHVLRQWTVYFMTKKASLEILESSLMHKETPMCWVRSSQCRWTFTYNFTSCHMHGQCRRESCGPKPQFTKTKLAIVVTYRSNHQTLMPVNWHRSHRQNVYTHRTRSIGTQAL